MPPPAIPPIGRRLVAVALSALLTLVACGCGTGPPEASTADHRLTAQPTARTAETDAEAMVRRVVEHMAAGEVEAAAELVCDVQTDVWEESRDVLAADLRRLDDLGDVHRVEVEELSTDHLGTTRLSYRLVGDPGRSGGGMWLQVEQGDDAPRCARPASRPPTTRRCWTCCATRSTPSLRPPRSVSTRTWWS